MSSHHAIAVARLNLGQTTRDLTGAAPRALGVLVQSGLEADRHGRWHSPSKISLLQAVLQERTRCPGEPVDNLGVYQC